MKTIYCLFIIGLMILLGGETLNARGRTRSYSPRPYYGGGHHTRSHGGSYIGGVGSSHRGGHYSNPRTGNRYGRHKW